jgi:hypothetical protein
MGWLGWDKGWSEVVLRTSEQSTLENLSAQGRRLQQGRSVRAARRPATRQSGVGSGPPLGAIAQLGTGSGPPPPSATWRKSRGLVGVGADRPPPAATRWGIWPFGSALLRY